MYKRQSKALQPIDGPVRPFGVERPAQQRSRVRPDVRGIILAGIHSWGESLLDRTMSRALWPVALRPLITYSIDWLGRGGVRDLVICANSNTVAVRSMLGVGESLGVGLAYYEDDTPRGPAGCACDAARMRDADTFIVAEGTIIPHFDMGLLLAAHKQSGAVVTVVAMEPGQQERNGESECEPAGVYVFSRSALDHISPQGFQDIKEGLIPRLYEAGQRVLPYFVGAGQVIRVTDTWSYFAANMRQLRQTAGQAHSREPAATQAGACVHPTATVHESARLIGPVYVGAGARVMADAAVVGPAVIGPHCSIESGAVLSNCVLWSRCTAGRESMLSQCILLDEAAVRPRSVKQAAIIAPPHRPGGRVGFLGRALAANG